MSRRTLLLILGIWQAGTPFLAAQQPFRNFNRPAAPQAPFNPNGNPVFAPNLFNNFNPNAAFNHNPNPNINPNLNPGANITYNSNLYPAYYPFYNPYYNPGYNPNLNQAMNPNLPPFLDTGFGQPGWSVQNAFNGGNQYLFNNPYGFAAPIVSRFTAFGQPGGFDANGNPAFQPGAGPMDAGLQVNPFVPWQAPNNPNFPNQNQFKMQNLLQQ